MTQPRIRFLTLILVMLVAWVPMGAAQAAGTDEIKNYAIDILPQDDGSLVITYAINWCVISNSAGPLSWFTVGMPNEQYQIMSSSGDVASVTSYNQGFNYQVRIDLPREVNAGECINATVEIHQYGLAYLDSNTNEVSFQFTPGWFDEVPVDVLQVTWQLPMDITQLKSLDPQPTTQSDSQAVWKTSLQPGEKYPLTVVYAKSAFPNYNPSQSTSTQATGSNPLGSNPSTSGSSSTQIASSGSSPDNSSTGSPIPGLAIPFSITTCLCMCVIAIVVLFVVVAIFRALGSAGRSYRSGGWLGGYPRGGGWLLGGGGGLGGGFGSPGRGGGGFTPRAGGGSGLFGGRGMSCACVSSGCACACAGGGRAGCSRKGFDVSGLFKDRLEKHAP